MKTLMSLGCLVAGLVMAAQPSSVQAGVGIGVSVPVGPVYAAPAPAYYPPPAYYAPPQVYVAPAPVYRPVVAPRYVVYDRYGRPYYYRRARRW
jgi:hypothetical protein